MCLFKHTITNKFKICEAKTAPKADKGQAIEQTDLGMAGKSQKTVIQTGVKTRNIRRVNQAQHSVTHKCGKLIGLQCSEDTESL